MFKPRTRRNILRVIPFGVLWFIFSIIYSLLEKGILGNLNYYPSTGVAYDFTRNILTIPIAGLIMGLFTGILEIVYFNNWLIRKSFTKKIALKSAIYLLIIVIFLIIIMLINALLTSGQHTLKSITTPVRLFLANYASLSILVYIASIIVITQFYTEFSDSIGTGTLSNFFMGKYHHPMEEERIFMFLDMKSSTTIAENLGHIQYFEMLKEYFFDLSAAIIDYGGTIYQYAGDEMIICWPIKVGLKNSNIIDCFFTMKQIIVKESGKYEKKFGIVPDFKAAMHSGKVTAGEIGSLKKEIVFTGDVLNTTARIQGLCNQLNADLLLSEDLKNILPFTPRYIFKSSGVYQLKGRALKMEVFETLVSV